MTIERKLKSSELEKYPKLKVNLSLKFNLKIESPRSDNRKKTKVFRIRKIQLKNHLQNSNDRVNFCLDFELEKYLLKIESPRSDNRKKIKVFGVV